MRKYLDYRRKGQLCSIVCFNYIASYKYLVEKGSGQESIHKTNHTHYFELPIGIRTRVNVLSSNPGEGA